MAQRVRKSGPTNLLVKLGQFPAQGNAPLPTEQLRQVLQGAHQLVRRFIEDHGSALLLQGIQMFPAVFLIHGQEALKGEPAGGQAGNGQCGHQRTGTGNTHHRHIVLRTQRHQVFPGVTDGGGSGVGDEGTALSGEQTLQNLRACGFRVVPVVADHGLFQSQVVQNFDRDPGVLRSDKIHL